MAAGRMNRLMEHVRRIALARDEAGWTDGQLLECFVKGRDEASFSALVRRHGPLVWGVCLRVLRSHHDAEDAFQATFLVLARKAASIKSPGLLANWLYGVASRTALKAKSARARRQAREQLVSALPEPKASQRDVWDDLQPFLERELNRLPDKYRAVIVLCDLERKARREAARELGVPEGTVASRLAAARNRLARQLRRHGVAVSAAALAAELPAKAAARVPAVTLSAAIKAATVATGHVNHIVSAKVAALVGGVLRAMVIDKIVRTTRIVLVLALIAVGGGFVQDQLAARQQGAVAAADDDSKGKAPLQAKQGDPPPQKPAEAKTDFRALLQQQRDAARAALDDLVRRIEAGTQMMSVDTVSWSKRLMDADLELANSGKERIAARERHWLFAKKLEATAQAGFNGGVKGYTNDLVAGLKYFRLEAEIGYLKEKAKTTR
jgi:RNA polymerase sigma factor (sigma-70 family)